jgi:hypothetical protein
VDYQELHPLLLNTFALLVVAVVVRLSKILIMLVERVLVVY